MKRFAFAALCAVLLCAGRASADEADLRTNEKVAGIATAGRLIERTKEAGAGRGRAYRYLVPSKKELAFAWADQPFIVQIPFTFSAPAGESARVVIMVGADGFDGPAGRLRDRDALTMAGPGDYVPAMGVIALDSTGLDGVDLQEVSEWEPILDTVPDKDAEGAVAVWRDPDEGTPYSFREGGLSKIASSESVVAKGARMDICFAPNAKRGRYAFWFAMPATSLWDYGRTLVPDTLRGRFLATLFTVRGAEFPGLYELEVAAGLEKQRAPDQPNLSLWTRLPDVEVDVELRCNGWVLDESHTLALPEEDPDLERQLTGSAGAFQGGATYDGDKHEWTTVYNFRFPQKIRDWSLFDVEVSGSLEVPRCGSRTPYGPWEMAFLHPHPSSLAALGFSEAAIGDASADRRNYRPSPLLDNMHGRRDLGYKTREAWIKAKGKARVDQWVEPNDWGWNRPGERSGVVRMRVGFPPSGAAPQGMGAVVDLGPWVLFHVALEEVGRFGQAYRRWSDVESNEKGVGVIDTKGPVTSSRQDDGMADWYRDEFCPISAKAEAKINECRGAAGLLGLALTRNEKHVRILQAALDTPSEILSADSRARMARRIEGLQHKIETDKGLLDMAVEAAEEAIEKTRASLAKQERRSKKAGWHRKDLVRWRDVWDDKKFSIGPTLYLEGANHEAWESAMADRDLSALPSGYRLKLANMYFDRKRLIPGLFALRSLLRTTPDAAEAEQARKLTGTMEAKLLRSVANKVSGEVRDAREKFYGWLESRGLPREAPSGIIGSGLEHLWTVLTTGPGAFASWLVGRTDAMELESQTVQEAGIGIWMGLQALISLTNRGTTLEEVAEGLGVRPGTPWRRPVLELRRRLGLERIGGQAYSDADYRGLGSQIMAALRLPEIDALLLENEDLFRLALEESHFDLESFDVSDVLADRMEFGFDLFSVKNQAMLLLPFSTGTIGGKMVPFSLRPWGLTKASNPVKAAEFLGREVRTGQEVFAAAVGWEAALGRLATSSAGQSAYKALETVHKSGGFVWKASWKASPFLADLALCQGIVHAANELGGPRIAAAVEAVTCTFLWDPSLCFTLMSRARTTPAMLQKLATRYGREVQHYTREMDRTRKYLLDLQDVLKARKLGRGKVRTLPYEVLETPKAGAVKFDLTVADHVPGSNHVANQRYAAQRASRALDAGDADEAARWAHAASEMDAPSAAQVQRLSEQLRDLNAAARGFAKVQIPRGSRLEIDEIVSLKLAKSADGSPLFKELLFDADRKLLLMDFDGAMKQYRAAILEAGAAPGGDIPRQVLLKLHIVEEAAKGRRQAAKLTREIEGAPVSRTDFDDVVRGVGDRPPDFPKSQNPVWGEPKGNPTHGLKRMGGPGSELVADAEVEKAMRAELIAAELGGLFGVYVPPAAGRLTRNADGKLIGELVNRWVPGDDLVKESVGKLLAVKDQFAEHRLFSMILGDHDRHLGNYKLLNGCLVTLDAGMGQPMRLSSAFNARIDEQVVDHFLRHRPEVKMPNLKMLEECLTWQDMKEPLRRAKQVFSRDEDKVRARLQKAMSQLYPDPTDAARLSEKAREAAEEALEAFKSRLKRIEPRLKQFTDRNDLPNHLKRFVPRRTGWVPAQRRPQPLRLVPAVERRAA